MSCRSRGGHETLQLVPHIAITTTCVTCDGSHSKTCFRLSVSSGFSFWTLTSESSTILTQNHGRLRPGDCWTGGAVCVAFPQERHGCSRRVRHLCTVGIRCPEVWCYEYGCIYIYYMLLEIRNHVYHPSSDWCSLRHCFMQLSLAFHQILWHWRHFSQRTSAARFRPPHPSLS